MWEWDSEKTRELISIKGRLGVKECKETTVVDHSFINARPQTPVRVKSSTKMDKDTNFMEPHHILLLDGVQCVLAGCGLSQSQTALRFEHVPSLFRNRQDLWSVVLMVKRCRKRQQRGWNKCFCLMV